uniref:glucuronosyltransferase n=1 Tax=Strongyloides papillosus TaxID=174720 RepID=A0A0N5CHU5_STREA
MFFLLKFFLTFPLLFNTSETYKILIFNPRRSHSHVQYIGRIADSLEEAGHSVTVLQPIQVPTIPTVGSKLARVIFTQSSINESVVMNLAKQFESDIWKKNSNNPLNVIEIISEMCELLKRNCRELITNTTLIDTFKKEKFDIAFSEVYAPCGFGLFEMLGIETVISGISTGLNEAYYEMFGLEFSPSYIPAIHGGTRVPKGIIERAKNMFFYLFSKYFYSKLFIDKDQEAFDEVLGKGKINIRKIMSKSSFHIVNSNPLLNFPHPTTSKVVEVAGIGIPEAKKVSEDYDRILSLRKRNVIMSFGSVAKSKRIPYEIKMSILKTFEQFPDTTFIWKYEDDDISFAKDYPDVILKKWIPQVDLLNDDRVNLFITHGGLNSAIEVSYQGVPSIFVPFFSDQKRNSFMIERYGCSIVIEKDVLNDPEKFKISITEILTNKKYLENAKKLTNMINIYPHEAKTKLIKSFEFAAEFGNIKEMDLPSIEMNFVELYNIDIYIILFSIIFILFLITIKVLKKIVQMCCKKQIIKNKKD